MADGVLVITGPTASGKTEIALEVARRLDGEIVSLDSRQVYRGLDIGTAKPTLAQRAAIPHHGLDLVEPDQRYSAGQFARDARRWIDEIHGRGRVSVVAGGTGFFLRALLDPLFVEPQLDGARRDHLLRWLTVQTPATLLHFASALDPAPGAADPQRLARRVEIALLTGRTLAWWHAHAPPGGDPLRALVTVLELPRTELYRRIDARVHAMIDAGLVGEVRELLRRGYDLHHPGMNATGYIQLVPHVRDDRPLAEAITLIQNATRGYARRQLTWFRRQLPVDALWLAGTDPASAVADRIVAEWRRWQR